MWQLRNTLIVALCLLAAPAWAQVQLDTTAQDFTGANATHDVPITVGSNSNRLLVVFAWVRDTGSVTISNVSGAGATWHDAGNCVGNGEYDGDIWIGVAPSTGAQTVDITASAAPSASQIAVVYSLYDAAQSSIESDVTCTTSGDAVITVPSNGLAVSVHIDANTQRTVTGCTTTEDITGFSNAGYSGANCNSATSTFTWSAFDTHSGAHSLAIAPAAAGGSTECRNLLLLGVGGACS